MYTKGKYVVGEIPTVVGSNMGAVCINELFSHTDLRSVFVPGSITSAGFFHVRDDLTVCCYGKSIGLKVTADPERDA